MPELEDFVLDMEDEDREALWERALLPFPSGNELENLLKYIDPEDPESNRVRVRNQLKQQTDTLPLDLGYPVIDLAVNQSPFETVGLEEDDIRLTVVDKQKRIESNESVLKTLKMLPVSDASNAANVVEGTVKRWRSGGSQTIPLEFWENYTQRVEDKAESLDVSSGTADLVDHNRYYYGGKSISESTVAEDMPLPKLARFGHLLDSEAQITEDNVSKLADLMDSYEPTVEPDENVKHYILGEFVDGAEPELFETFLKNSSYFGREFSGMVPYQRQQMIDDSIGENGYVEDWYNILEEIGMSTQEGVFVSTQHIKEIRDTIQDYRLDQYRNPA